MPTHSALGSRDGVDRPSFDWEVVEESIRQARRMRAEAFVQLLAAPRNWLRARIERARAPLDFAPFGTCP